MKNLSIPQRQDIIGEYHAPEGLYEYIQSLPFLGTVSSNVTTLTAGEWTEILLTYEVGGSGLADGAWIKATFKFYSDWALFQTSDPTKPNHVSAEYIPHDLFPRQTPATVQNLHVRFDQKGHERPFQKAIIIDIVDGYLNPGDKILIRLGDRRYGAKGTRVQTFVESDFRWRFYLDPVGTSRFAGIMPDISWEILPGSPEKLEIVTPRLVRSGTAFTIRAQVEDVWGNVVKDVNGLVMVIAVHGPHGLQIDVKRIVPEQGWSNIEVRDVRLLDPGSYTVQAKLINIKGEEVLEKTSPLTVSSNAIVPRTFFGDLHVHSDDTVGTENSLYNFSYGRDIAGLDVLGYTANDFQISKARWEATVNLIDSLNKPGSFVIYPGTEWCGNSAAGGDHNVVFLADPKLNPPEFPFDRHGNVARSFEWSEDGPKDLVAGAWPLDEVYAMYAGESDTHLMIPHVGGRRCNLGWHHPKLERLVEIGSAWGQFEWLLRDAVTRGWKLGVCANSDEHRGRCGGGVPGTAVFGTRGGLTGILADSLDRESIAAALRARHTFATTGPRLVGIVKADSGEIQGDEMVCQSGQSLVLNYQFFGNQGFSSIEAYDASGLFLIRDFWEERSESPRTVLRVTWEGARLYDRYREAVWEGEIRLSSRAEIQQVRVLGGLTYNPEDEIKQLDGHTIRFSSRTSGDIDGVHLYFADALPDMISISGSLGGYVKVGDALAGNPHKPQPNFTLEAGWDDLLTPNGKRTEIAGGVGLFVTARAILDVELPIDVEGKLVLSGAAGEQRAVYFVGREWSGDKVITSPMYLNFA